MKKKTVSKKKPLNYNHAENFEFAEQTKTQLLENWRILKADREARESIWQDGYRAWSIDRLETDRQYDGRANLHMPQIGKEVETMSRRIYKEYFLTITSRPNLLGSKMKNSPRSTRMLFGTI